MSDIHILSIFAKLALGFVVLVSVGGIWCFFHLMVRLHRLRDEVETFTVLSERFRQELSESDDKNREVDESGRRFEMMQRIYRHLLGEAETQELEREQPISQLHELLLKKERVQGGLSVMEERLALITSSVKETKLRRVMSLLDDMKNITMERELRHWSVVGLNLSSSIVLLGGIFGTLVSIDGMTVADTTLLPSVLLPGAWAVLACIVLFVLRAIYFYRFEAAFTEMDNVTMSLFIPLFQPSSAIQQDLEQLLNSFMPLFDGKQGANSNSLHNLMTLIETRFSDQKGHLVKINKLLRKLTVPSKKNMTAPMDDMLSAFNMFTSMEKGDLELLVALRNQQRCVKAACLGLSAVIREQASIVQQLQVILQPVLRFSSGAQVITNFKSRFIHLLESILGTEQLAHYPALESMPNDKLCHLFVQIAESKINCCNREILKRQEKLHQLTRKMYDFAHHMQLQIMSVNEVVRCCNAATEQTIASVQVLHQVTQLMGDNIMHEQWRWSENRVRYDARLHFEEKASMFTCAQRIISPFINLANRFIINVFPSWKQLAVRSKVIIEGAPSVTLSDKIKYWFGKILRLCRFRNKYLYIGVAALCALLIMWLGYGLSQDAPETQPENTVQQRMSTSEKQKLHKTKHFKKLDKFIEQVYRKFNFKQQQI